MRCLFFATAFLSILVVGKARGFESFYVPVIARDSGTGEIAGVPVELVWNTTASVPTLSGIRLLESTGNPVVLARAGTEAEVVASAAEFIDSHSDWFRASSRNLDLRAHASMGGHAWTVNSSQFFQGILVLGGYAQLITTNDGGLMILSARLFPEEDLRGLGTVTEVNSERALEIAHSVQEHLVPAPEYPPEKIIAFRGKSPFIAWRVEAYDTRERDASPGWSFLIDGTTGEVLAVYDRALSAVSGVFIRGDANGDKTIDIADAVAILSALFLETGSLRCPDAADADDNGRLEVTDAVYGLNYLFLGGRPPARPFPASGPDITSDSLPCVLETTSN